MEKKTSLIVGGSGGIGIETARFLYNKNMNVCLTYYQNEEKIRKKLEENNIKNFDLYKVDVRDNKSIQNAILNIFQKYEKIDSVVYSISTLITNKKVLDLEWNDFQEHIDVQIKGLFILVKTILSLIKRNHKIKFVVILTEACIGKPPSMLSHYITAKYGLMGFVKCMASELIQNGCTFNMISPGMVKTDLLLNFPPKLVEIISHNNPMRRIAEPEDIAKVIYFLISDDSDYLNGINIVVNGGNVFI